MIKWTGAWNRFNAIRWTVARNIGVAWVLTIPDTALTAALAYWILNPILG